MKVFLLLTLLIALAATAMGLFYLRRASATDRWYYAAYNKIEEIAFEKTANVALQKAVQEARSADKDRGVSQTIGRFFIYLSLGTLGLSCIPVILLFKRKP